MISVKFLVIFITFNCVCVSCHKIVEIDLNLEDKIKEGEKHYKDLTDKISTYGSCWQRAISDLHRGCKHLTQDVQSKLALSFANCFLENSGSDTCPCPEDSPISSCLRNVSDRVFSTYTQFFTHAQSICYFLQHKSWQEETEKTVIKLAENSEIVSNKLDESSKFQSKILGLQQIAFLDQKKLIANGRILSTVLEKSENAAKAVFQEFKSVTSEQHMMIFQLFEQIKKLQSIVIGEFTGFYTFVCYAVAAVVVYFLTSVPRTADSRIWLFLLITLSAFLERLIVSYSLTEDSLNLLPLQADGPIYYRIWICRRLTCAIAFLILIVYYYQYKDYNIINNQLLTDIQKQNLEIQCFIKNMNTIPVNFSQHLPKENVGAIGSLDTHLNITALSPISDAEKSFESTFKVSAKKLSVKPVNKRSRGEKRNKDSSVVTSPQVRQKTNLDDKFESPTFGRYNLRSRTNSPSVVKSPQNFASQLQEAAEALLYHKAIVERM